MYSDNIAIHDMYMYPFTLYYMTVERPHCCHLSYLRIVYLRKLSSVFTELILVLTELIQLICGKTGFLLIATTQSMNAVLNCISDGGVVATLGHLLDKRPLQTYSKPSM